MLVPSCPMMHIARPALLVLGLLLLLADAETPPKFLRTPNDQTGVQGGVASFICQATGDPRPKIVWNKKGKKVSNQRFEVIDFDDGSGSVLRIQPLRTPRDEAIYECVASNTVGELSATTRLTVLREDQLPPGFPTIDMGPQLKVVERTRTATMLCAASGNPDPDISWFKDFLPVNTTNNNGRIKQLRSESFGGTPIRGALQIEQSEESDQGKYECVATNNDGTRYSAPANLYVRELREVRRVPPRFSIPPTDNEIMPGGSVNITCVAVGSPMPYVKWMLGAEDLTPEDDMPIGRNVLELTDVRQSNNYTCVAMSTLGVIEAVAQITVKALPKPPGIPLVTERTATSITLTWDSGNPEPVSYYIIQHKSKISEDTYKEIDGVATTRYSVGGLSPYSDYEFRVVAVNNIGRGPPSDGIEAKTAEQAPSTAPRQVRGRMLSATTAIIHWDEPEEANGQIMGYRVYYTMDSAQHVNLWEKQIVRGSNFLTIQGLIPNKTYYIKVLAYTSVGDGPLSADLQIIAKTGVPSQPTDFKGEAKSETSILLSWIAPAQTGQDNQIMGYELLYKKGDDKEEKRISFEPTTTYLLKDLKPFTTYTFQLAARSKHGIGAYTNEISAETPQTLFAKNFHVKAAMKTSVLLTWEIPDNYNAAQPFTILYDNGQSVEVDGKLTQKLITGLQAGTQYSFLLTNRGNSAGGLQHRVSTMTAPDILRTKPYLIGKTNLDGMVSVELPSVQTSEKVRGYYIVVVPLKKQRTGKYLKPWDSPDEMNLEELLKEINRTSRGLRFRRQAEPKAYIAAYFKDLPTEFTLGDTKIYGDFENKQLANGQEYIFFVLAVLEISENTMYATSPYSDPVVSADLDPQPIIDEEEGLIWVVGPVLAVVFIICIVIAILLYKSSKPDRKRAESEARKGSLPNSKEIPSHNPTDPVELRRMNFQTPGMASHPPIPILDLADHLERLKANDNLKFSQEYESIDPGQQFTWEHSNLEVNKPKNRYANVIAYDHSRVLLSAIDGIPGSDYINSNYIDGYRKQNAYIATQGSLPETFGDFWRMIWEQRSANIVMMTKLEERSRVKCDQYWPTRGTETYGLIQVTLLDTVELATYCVRTFALYKNGSSEKREVRQFQFTAWPDHGVPEHPTPFLAFLRRVKACNPPDAGPMVVHCSAGVGRTGCFIVIDAMMERIKHEKTVDIYGHVTLMRAQRNYMVQTEDQYVFIHDALQEAVTCGTTEVPARNLYAYIQKLTGIEGGENVSGMELEFKRLANTKAHTSRFISANLPCNKFKNRLVNIMPYESTRVCLQPIRGVEGSDYINASFIDGYRQQKAYIATQGPLAETTEDFWRMLWEHNSTIVVMLTKLREMGREKCHQYWPAERSARYQYFVVDPMAEYNMPQYILREFKVTDARDGQSRTVRQFQFTDWPEQGVPKSGEGFIDFIGQVHKTKEQFGQDGPISVHCSAGVGRTGVFITLSIVLERMRYEGVVDIFQTVKMLRTQRPAMVQTEDQYQFCYRAGLEYLGSFDHYAT
ncbi:receptor-type tyrosine-protein phosphatase delta isoform X23 [Oncorhynchus tshawytscha]|uniref:receptor-type tyrosine-protein phosphatase delta isoform X26 n=1 Tax=Oncorhynchus mykiss TaxID=8022 RepID=UPI000B4F44DE|nr:receptor-type tyrosine-protein phosphatase delta isoform X26 [Oncorhynchus mykiss]XP_023837635.1 receptor-type tyrosine-protein phosphatase delta-like isoform X20 [Salvelinus alpinus]XP_029530384.1 receptor-type tyrosine-protein phosphatase delta-like isoform X23 [Oncorhynchus nerka]XP_031647916.1 receptor-type tyrosine-protein phosphatase delta-like isoform X19 [Oncorhynchus kisutch]XP_042184317.1 receptor-type tyrosine-protein phosphatase delta isoform X23 [Oncorhynchus tshawytscha]